MRYGHLTTTLAVIVLWSSILDGCSVDGTTGSSLTVEDSAGVTVFRAAAGAEAVEWHLADAPELVIGPDDGAETGPLFRVRSAHRFEDGSIVVANGGTFELRLYSPDGALQRTVGREGGGPGEFGFLGGLEVVGDSVWVDDADSGRLSVFDRRGRLARTIPVRSDGSDALVRVEGVFENGAVLMARNEPWDGPVMGLREVFRLLGVRTPEGSVVPQGRFFTSESYWQELEPGHVADGGRPFARRAFFATHGTDWYYTAGAEYRVEQYDQQARLRGVYARSDEPTRVREGDLDALVEELWGERDEPSVLERMWRNAPLPERMPAYDDLAVDRSGNLWARRHAGAAVRNCWDVFQRTPPVLAGLCFPERFRVLDIGEDWALGVLLDELDVETLALFRLSK